LEPTVFLKIIQAMSYAVAKGIFDAWWDKMAEPLTAVEEEVTDADLTKGDHIRDRFAALRVQDKGDGDREPEGSAPTDGADGGEGMA
jgi:hypothetical protein